MLISNNVDRVLILVLSLSLSFCPFVYSQSASGGKSEEIPGLEKKIRIEGIVPDAKDPSASLVMINGNVYKKGQTVNGFEVVSVQGDSILVKETASGKEGKVSLSGGSGKRASSALDALSPKQGFNPFNLGKKKLTPAERQMKKDKKSLFDFSSFLNQGWESRALGDMRTIHSCGAIFFMQHGRSPASIQEMVDAKIIEDKFPNNESGKYRFTLKPALDGVAINADPIDPEENLTHYFLGFDGKVRLEKNRPATAESPIFQPFLGLSEQKK